MDLGRPERIAVREAKPKGKDEGNSRSDNKQLNRDGTSRRLPYSFLFKPLRLCNIAKVALHVALAVSLVGLSLEL